MKRAPRRALLLSILLAAGIVAPAFRAAAYQPQLLRCGRLQGHAQLGHRPVGDDRLRHLRPGREGALHGPQGHGTKTAITVGASGEYQWKAKLTGLAADRPYCYRVFLGRARLDLLGSDPSPVFRTQVPPPARAGPTRSR